MLFADGITNLRHHRIGLADLCHDSAIQASLMALAAPSVRQNEQDLLLSLTRDFRGEIMLVASVVHIDCVDMRRDSAKLKQAWLCSRCYLMFCAWHASTTLIVSPSMM